MSWNIEITTDWDQIWEESHVKQWLLHMDASPAAHVFFHPSLIQAWVDTYRPLRNISPLFVWADHGDDNKLFLPLVLWKKNGKNAFMKSIVPAGYADFDYHDPICKKNPSREEICSFWNDLTDKLEERVSFDEIMIDGIHKNYIPEEWEILDEEPCPYIDIQKYSNIDDYLTTRNKKMRYNLRRQERKAAETIDLSFFTFSADTIKESIQDIPLLLEYHRKRWPNAYKAPDFHKNLAREGLLSGILHFSRLDFNGNPASWRIGFYYKDTYYSYMPVINPAHFEHAPGKLHLLFCIDFAIKNGAKKYDQLRGSELYKSEWTQDSNNIYTVRRLNATLSSKLKNAILKLKYFTH